MTDSSGTLQNHIEYDGYGNVVSESNSSFGDRYKYTSREWDAEIDLQYNRARFYDPSIGRWISEDPIGFDAGDTNLQRYVNNAPTMGTDPSGMWEQPPSDSLDMIGGRTLTLGSQKANSNSFPEKKTWVGWSYGWVGWGLGVASTIGPKFLHTGPSLGISIPLDRIKKVNRPIADIAISKRDSELGKRYLSLPSQAMRALGDRVEPSTFISGVIGRSGRAALQGLRIKSSPNY